MWIVDHVRRIWKLMPKPQGRPHRNGVKFSSAMWAVHVWVVGNSASPQGSLRKRCNSSAQLWEEETATSSIRENGVRGLQFIVVIKGAEYNGNLVILVINSQLGNAIPALSHDIVVIIAKVDDQLYPKVTLTVWAERVSLNVGSMMGSDDWIKSCWCLCNLWHDLAFEVPNIGGHANEFPFLTLQVT